MALTTLLGSAQLSLQDALSRGLERDGLRVAAPNFVTVSLRRDAFLRDIASDSTDHLERVRRDLEAAMRRFIESHGWPLGGSGVVTLNLLLRSIEEDCRVQARTVRSLCELRIRDDLGTRSVHMVGGRAILGRPHAPSPGGFIPLHDGLRLVSREHIELIYRDLELRGRLLGRNPTTLNDKPLAHDERFLLRRGDLLRCGTCDVEIVSIE